MGITCCMTPREKNLEINKEIIQNIKQNKRMILFNEIPSFLDNYIIKLGDNNAQGEDTIIIACCSDIEGENSITSYNWQFSKLKNIKNPHKHRIDSLAVFPSLNYQQNSKFHDCCFVTGDAIGSIKLWDSNVEEICSVEKAHERAIESLAIIPSLELIVSNSIDSLKIWDKQKNEAGGNKLNLIRSLESTGFERLCAVPFRPNEYHITVSNGNSDIIVFDTGLKEISKKEASHLKEINQIKYIKISNQAFIVTLDDSGTIKLWDKAMKLKAEKLEAHPNAFELITLNYKINELGEAIGLIATHSNKQIRIWDDKFNCIREIKMDEISVIYPCDIDNEILMIVISNNKKLNIYK